MRKLKITIVVWFDPQWRSNFRVSWKRLGYWMKVYRQGKGIVMEFGAFDFHFVIEGPKALSDGE
ncbi:MAG: hypothetical protein ACRDGM_04310 [bacterium]